MTPVPCVPGTPPPPGSRERSPLPPRPRFSPADIRGNLAEARLLRCIGMGQPIKASWLCLETLNIYRQHRLPSDLDLVDALRVLTLAYTDALKRGNTGYLPHAEDAMRELGALGGVPDAVSLHRRCQREPGWDPSADLRVWKIRIPPGAAADPDLLMDEEESEAPARPRSVRLRTPRLRLPLAEVAREAFPLPADPYGCLEPGTRPGVEILLDPPVRHQARYECLYLHGLVDMSQALRIERSIRGTPNPTQLQEELSHLIEAAWWFHLAGLVAPEAPANPDECYRKARAKSSMLIRRIEAGKHFEMPALELVDRLE